jgi:cysteine desulfuration protein SufE
MANLNIPNIDELTETFELFDDWEDKYRFLIELGGKLPPMADALKNTETKVEGCTSQVWIVIKPTDDETIDFWADSDAHIVRGLIAVIYAIFHRRSLAEAQNIDVDGYFERLGLGSHISPNRRNGFFAMVERIKALSDKQVK